MDDPLKDREWERGFAGHEEAQLRRLARLPFREKLRWLEEAHRHVRHLERRRSDARDPRDPRES